MRHSAPAPARRWWDQVPYAVVLACVAGVLVATAVSQSGVKSGTLAVGGVMLAAALARLVLPERRAGMLASRRRLADVAALAALGAGLAALGLVFPAQ